MNVLHIHIGLDWIVVGPTTTHTRFDEVVLIFRFNKIIIFGFACSLCTPFSLSHFLLYPALCTQTDSQRHNAKNSTFSTLFGNSYYAFFRISLHFISFFLRSFLSFTSTHGQELHTFAIFHRTFGGKRFDWKETTERTKYKQIFIKMNSNRIVE